MKSIMRKFHGVAIVILLGGLIAMPATAAAVDVLPICNSGGAGGTDASSTHVCQDVNAQKNNGSNPIINIIKDAIQVIAFIAGIAAVIMIIVSGILFVTAGGDTNSAARARGALMYALVGLAVAGLAETIVTFVLDKVS